MCFVLELIIPRIAVASDLRRRGGVCAGGCKGAVCGKVICREGCEESRCRERLHSQKGTL